MAKRGGRYKLTVEKLQKPEWDIYTEAEKTEKITLKLQAQIWIATINFHEMNRIYHSSSGIVNSISEYNIQYEHELTELEASIHYSRNILVAPSVLASFHKGLKVALFPCIYEKLQNHHIMNKKSYLIAKNMKGQGWTHPHLISEFSSIAIRGKEYNYTIKHKVPLQ